MKKSSRKSARSQIVDYMRKQLIGPAYAVDEELREPPDKRYLMGVLYPRDCSFEMTTKEEEEETCGNADEDGNCAEDPLRLSRQNKPASFGLSFYLEKSASLNCEIWGAEYEEKDPGRWVRRVISTGDNPEITKLYPPQVGEQVSGRVLVLGGKASLHSIWRSFPSGFLVTVSLVNESRYEDESGHPDPSCCLYQCGLACTAAEGGFLPYPDYESLTSDEEEQELELIYRRSAVTFAVGHGCAAVWDVSEARTANRLVAEFMPESLVHSVQHTKSTDILKLSFLADAEKHPREVIEGLYGFLAEYEKWIDGLPAQHTDIPVHLCGARDRVLGRLSIVSGRIRKGIDLLRDNPGALRAFALANRAMLMQMYHYSRLSNDGCGSGVSRIPLKPDYSSEISEWRPFQMAFILLVMPSLVEDDNCRFSDDRNIVDLLWFPTGGGKTEAYLAIAAFEIFRRRIAYRENGAGTSVIMRYTLRLLTAQQFERTTAMICACELIRRSVPEELGKAPVSIGLWIGSKASPNSFADALRLYRELRDGGARENKFQLEKCPWCGTAIIPSRPSDSDNDYGIVADESSFSFHCPSAPCPFNDELPINVVDEHLYDKPPTFLVATIDKFAQLPWRSGAGAFFGTETIRPPSLIIQDELHLISGPLGTIAGLYESAIDALIGLRGGNAKIIASTATIRSASDQVLGLFARRTSVFPPPGLSSDDSYFAVEDKNGPGRLYVGVLGPGHTAVTALVHTASLLSQAPVELSLGLPERDGYWTQVIYHNSLRELGKTITMSMDDFPSRIRDVLATDQSHCRCLDFDGILELTSNIGASQLPALLEQLKRDCSRNDAISIAACTNMFSVGVDVQRLALMLVNGQPKTTSEYIQCTSRVGRGKVPGLIVAMFSPTKPRDRSHYESFTIYHRALYRHVEPTSVTPFSAPARARVLHTYPVIVARHLSGLSENEDADRFNPDCPEVTAAVQLLQERIGLIDADELEDSMIQLRAILDEWAVLAEQARRLGAKPLRFHGDGLQFESLLRRGDDASKGWDTPDAMRNVDRACLVKEI